jgi:hypothetical protein
MIFSQNELYFKCCRSIRIDFQFQLFKIRMKRKKQFSDRNIYRNILMTSERAKKKTHKKKTDNILDWKRLEKNNEEIVSLSK